MRDHKPRSTKKAPRRGLSFLSSVFLFFSGLAAGLGVAAMLAYRVNQVPLPLIAPPTRDVQVPLSLEPERKEEESLEFHSILRDRDPPRIGEDPPDPAAGRPEEEEEPGAFFIQVGSFGERGRAEALRGELALLNIKASVRPAGDGDGRRYRVVVGPYETAAATEETKARLALNGYNSNVLSMRPQ